MKENNDSSFNNIQDEDEAEDLIKINQMLEEVNKKKRGRE